MFQQAGIPVFQQASIPVAGAHLPAGGRSGLGGLAASSGGEGEGAGQPVLGIPNFLDLVLLLGTCEAGWRCGGWCGGGDLRCGVSFGH